jgi:ArsR family metal-binding transcriptional regulator
MMLIESYNIEIEISTHSMEHLEFEAFVHFDVDISPVLPYLNTVLSSGIYLPDTPALSWRYDGHNIGFWPHRIALGDLATREEAEELATRLVKLVNHTWEKRDEIDPDPTTHKRLQPLELYQLLPQTNCKACGEPTCFSFALKLVAGQATLEACTPLYDPATAATYSAQRTQLGSLLASKWPAF